MDVRSRTVTVRTERPDEMAVLQQCELCREMPLLEAKRILSKCHLAFAERGDLLWSAGTESRFFAIIAEGVLMLSRKSIQGREVVVEVLGPGASAGILATLLGTPYPLSSVAITDMWYLKVPRAVWDEMPASHPEFRERALHDLGERLLRGFDYHAALLSGGVEQRLATAVLKVHELLGGTANLPITRQHLAEIACVTVESAIRVTSKWQERGWITSGYRSIKLKNLSALKDVLTQPARPSKV
jgi:CRP-like cAMP-binding protein